MTIHSMMKDFHVLRAAGAPQGAARVVVVVVAAADRVSRVSSCVNPPALTGSRGYVPVEFTRSDRESTRSDRESTLPDRESTRFVRPPQAKFAALEATPSETLARLRRSKQGDK
eukprot:4978910-Pyramimonas_sp.AAC.1